MRPSCHLAASVALSGPVYLATRSWPITISFALTQVLVDIDHVVDHILWGERGLRLRDLMTVGIQRQWRRMVYGLHAYEWLFPLIGLAVVTRNPILMGTAAGMAVHMLMDEIGNRMPWVDLRIAPLFYFITFRMLMGFRRDRMGRENLPPASS